MIFVAAISFRHEIFNHVPWRFGVAHASFASPCIHWCLNMICKLKSFVFRCYTETVKKMVGREFFCCVHVAVNEISKTCFSTLDIRKFSHKSETQMKAVLLSLNTCHNIILFGLLINNLINDDVVHTMKWFWNCFQVQMLGLFS